MKKIKIKEEKYYEISINHSGRILNYLGKIISIKNNKFYLKTNGDCNLEFNLKDIISIKEISKPEKEIPIIKKQRFNPKHKLEPSIEPKF